MLGISNKMKTLTLQTFYDQQWLDIALLQFNEDYQIVNFAYQTDYITQFFGETGARAVSVNYPVDFFIEQPAEQWQFFLNDIIPAGANRRYWLETLDIKHLPPYQQTYLLLKHGAIAPIGNLRIKEAVPESVEKRSFSLEIVKNRQSDFLEYAHQSGAIVGGATGAGGEAPKLLLRRLADTVWIDNQQDGTGSDDYYLVKYPRGNYSPLDCDILRAEFYYYQELSDLGFSTIDTNKMKLEEGRHYPSLWLPRFDIVRENEVNERYAVESIYSMLNKHGGLLDQERTLRQLIEKMQQSCLIMPNIADFVLEWVQRDLLNIAFGNSDNHGRNTAFLRNRSQIWLAPIFDFAPMRADPEGIIRTMTWQKACEFAGEYHFEYIAESLSDLVKPDILLEELRKLAIKLVNLKERLQQRGVPKSILDFPAIGFDYLPEKLQRWGLV